VETPDANGKGANSAGEVVFRTIVGDPTTATDEADVSVNISLSDVRAATGLGDYTGELQEVSTVRITDHANGNGESGTVQAVPLGVTVPCASTPETTRGGSCSVSTSFDAVMPGAVLEGRRAIWELGQIQVLDGGPDGAAATGGNSLFAVQGVFVP
jgi:hypothetical protein